MLCIKFYKEKKKKKKKKRGLLILLIANRRDNRTEDPLQRDDPLPSPGGHVGSVWGARRWRNISWSPLEIM